MRLDRLSARRPFSGPYSPGGWRGEAGAAARSRGRQRGRRRRRRAELAEPVQRLGRRQRRAVASSPAATPADSATSRRSMSTNRPDSGRSDQSALAVTWNSTIRPAPRGAWVTSGVPSASRAQVASLSCAPGSASTWRVTFTSSGTARPANGEFGGEAGQPGRLAPRHRPAELAVAGQQLHRQQRIRVLGQPRPGESQQQPALFHPGRQRGAVRPVGEAGVGQHQHRQLARQQLRQIALADFGALLQGAADIVELAGQRRRRGAEIAGQQPDRAAAPALVQQQHRRRPRTAPPAPAGPAGCAARAAGRSAPRPRWPAGRSLPPRAPGCGRRRSAPAPRPRRAGRAPPRPRAPPAGRRRRAAAAADGRGAPASRSTSPARPRRAPRRNRPSRRRRSVPSAQVHRRAAAAPSRAAPPRRRRDRPARASGRSAASRVRSLRHRHGGGGRRGRRRSRAARCASSADRAAFALGAVQHGFGGGHAARPVHRRRPAVIDHQQQRPAARQAAPASSTGRARPTITSPAASMRSSSSHHGVRAGVSAVAVSPSSRRTRGKVFAPRRRRGDAQQPPQQRQRRQREQHPGIGGARSRIIAAAPRAACGASAVYSAEQRGFRRMVGAMDGEAEPGGGADRGEPRLLRRPVARAYAVAHPLDPRDQRLRPLPQPSNRTRPLYGSSASAGSSTCRRCPVTGTAASRPTTAWISLQRREEIADQHHPRMPRQGDIGRQPVAVGQAAPVRAASRSSPARPEAGARRRRAGAPARRRAAAARPAPASAAPARSILAVTALAGECQRMLAEPSRHRQTVCAASHSVSRT